MLIPTVSKNNYCMNLNDRFCPESIRSKLVVIVTFYKVSVSDCILVFYIQTQRRFLKFH